MVVLGGGEPAALAGRERARPRRRARVHRGPGRAGAGGGPVTVGVGRALSAVLELHGEHLVLEGGLKGGGCGGGGGGGAVGGLRRRGGGVGVGGLAALVDLGGVGDEAVEAGGDGVLPLLLVGRVAAAVHGGGVRGGGWK